MPDRDDRAGTGKASKAKPVTKSYLADQLTRLESQFGAVSLDASGNPIVKRHPHDRTEIDADFPALGAEGQPGKKITGGQRYHGGEKHNLGGIADVRVVSGAVKAKPRRLSIGRIDDTDTASAQSPINADVRLNGGDHGRRDRRAGDPGRGNNNRDGREHDRGARRKHKKGEYGDEGTAKKPWRAVVVDSSALMWSPQAVRRLVGHGWEVVVPLEALHTLDLLKTGNSPSARAARSATRYIEHASRHHKVSNHGTQKRGRGLRLQRDDETCPPDTISTLPVPMLDEEGLPPWMERILGCAAFFLKLAHKDKPQTPSIPSNPDDASQTHGDDGLGGEDAQTQDEVRSMDLEFDPEEDDDSGAVLFVANPPLNVEVRQGETTGIDERAEGYLISQEATRFEITLEVLRDEEEELEEHGDNARRGGGGARGRNGNGNGRGKNGVDGRRRKEKDEESDEREVRILLRRPTEAEGQKTTNGPQGQGSTSPGIPAPLLSSPSTAARSPLPANGVVAPLEGPAMSPRPTSRHPPPGPPPFPHPPPPPRGHGPSRGHPPGHHHHPSPHRGRRPDDQSDSASDISARGKGDLSRRGRDGRGRGRGRGRGGGDIPGRGRGGGGGRGGMRTGGEFVPLQRPTRQDDRTNGVRRDVDARDAREARDARDGRDGRPAGGATRESDRPKVVLLQRPR